MATLTTNIIRKKNKQETMAYIDLPAEYPGIRSLMMYRPETALPLNELAQTLLRGPSTLSPGEREMIASYVSKRNECKYCSSTHGAIARHLLEDKESIVQQVWADPETAEISNKLKALLQIAGKVQESGKKVTETHIRTAKEAGATDIEIHDTVLIAAAFCMFNRYVDGLGTWAPDDQDLYDRIGKQRADEGYMTKPFAVDNDQ